MNPVAFVLLAAAIACFAYMSFVRAPRKNWTNPGLAFFAAAVMAQWVWQTVHRVIVK